MRRISQPLVPADEPEASNREQSPPRKPVSRIVHIINLVRPFTLGQLKQLLGRTGTLMDTGFWMNNIKSHCYATVSGWSPLASCRQRRPANPSVFGGITSA